MPRSSLLILAGARAAVEGVPLAIAACLVLSTSGRSPAPLEVWADSAAALLFWAAIGPVVTSVRLRAALALATAVAAAGLAVATVGSWDLGGWPAALAGSLYGVLLVSRGLGVAGSAISWRAVALEGLAATGALVVGALAIPAKTALAVLAVIAGGAAVAALSVARGAEETFGTPQVAARRRPGLVSAVLVGVGALAAAASLPHAGVLLGAIAAAAQPLLRALIVILVTPFVYVADALVRAILPFLRSVKITLPPFLSELDPAAEEEYARQFSIEAQVFLERFLLAVTLLVIATLVVRAVFARVLLARSTETLEREQIAGARLVDLVRGLFDRSVRPRPPRPGGDDPHARIRRAYWDLLALAERSGAAWRHPAQTPREHLAALAGQAWVAADGVVSPYERSRYGDRATPADAEKAERALREVERGVQVRV